MKLPRRKFLNLAASAAALPAMSRVARAQAYPARPVRLIEGFGAGGGADIMARLIGQWLSSDSGNRSSSRTAVARQQYCHRGGPAWVLPPKPTWLRP